jgi:hypothetical protein
LKYPPTAVGGISDFLCKAVYLREIESDLQTVEIVLVTCEP